MATGLSVNRNKKSGLATLSCFLKHKYYAANSVVISSMSLTVLDIFHYSLKCVTKKLYQNPRLSYYASICNVR